MLACVRNIASRLITENHNARKQYRIIKVNILIKMPHQRNNYTAAFVRRLIFEQLAEDKGIHDVVKWRSVPTDGLLSPMSITAMPLSNRPSPACHQIFDITSNVSRHHFATQAHYKCRQPLYLRAYHDGMAIKILLALHQSSCQRSTLLVYADCAS